MAAKLTRLTHKIEIKLHVVAEICTVCRSSSRRPVRKFVDKSSYIDEACTSNFPLGSYLRVTCVHTVHQIIYSVTVLALLYHDWHSCCSNQDSNEDG